MRPEEAPALAELWTRTWAAKSRSQGHEPRDQDAASLERAAAGFAHIERTSPGGSFVATSGGRIVGLATGLVRGDTYVLAHLAVDPEQQDKGIGGKVLSAALAFGQDSPRGLICSSPDPRAVQRYVRAGFRCTPCMIATGRPGQSAASSLRLSDGSPADLAAAAELDRLTRGVSLQDDVAHLRSTGAELWVDDDGAYAVRTGEFIHSLTAASPALAKRTLAALLSGSATGTPLTAMWLTDATPWAFEAAAAVRARCQGWGALMFRGAWPSARTYLPSELFS